MNKNTKSRKWQITINNPTDHNMTHDTIKEILQNFSNCTYWCMCDEIGNETGTYHTHIFLFIPNNCSFAKIKNNFKSAHIENARGTCQENRDYIRKEGKYASSDKRETNLPATFEEFGKLPEEVQGKRNDLALLYALIESGASDYEILQLFPQYFTKLDHIRKTREVILSEKYKKVWRELEVTYIYGTAGVGKTRSVMEKYGYENVYRITDYKNPFDNYNCEDIVVFEEFRSSLKIQDMLNYLDGYPLSLPCRYANKTACFTKVYIITNIAPKNQYETIQTEAPETWAAFCRRIHQVQEFKQNPSSGNTCIYHYNSIDACTKAFPYKMEEI